MHLPAGTASPQIGSLNENPLHADLKRWYAQPGDQIEVSVDGFVVDIARGNLLVEIQTGSFASVKRKISRLTASHPVRLVYPIAQEKWIVKLAEDGRGPLSRRKSPKRGRVEEIFNELVSFPGLICSTNLSLDVLLIQEEEVRRYDVRRGWRRKGWITHERRLLRVVEQCSFETPADLTALLPPCLPDCFTTAELAEISGGTRRLAQRMAYCLRKMGTITPIGRDGNAIVYIVSPT